MFEISRDSVQRVQIQLNDLNSWIVVIQIINWASVGIHRRIFN